MVLTSCLSVSRHKRTISISGIKLASARRRASLSQEELAQKSGLKLSSIKRIEPLAETGVYLATVRRLAEALSIDVSELYSTDTSAIDDAMSGLLKELNDTPSEVLRAPGAIREVVERHISDPAAADDLTSTFLHMMGEPSIEVDEEATRAIGGKPPRRNSGGEGKTKAGS